ncbi:MAG: hypothetical protein WKF77_27185 [Planctomycetaceae bacterium]
MTIRYTCAGCESVLKIKDEKAGTNGRCPKCKTEFVVPFPAEDDDNDVEVHVASKASVPVDTPVDDVDMPIELTPEVEDNSDFDPLDVLSGPAAASARTVAQRNSPAVSEKKPSVAELMRDFEAGKKKERKRDSASDVSVPTTAPASADQTSGSAANALSRAYQQKRDSASAPTMSVKDVKAAEERTLMMDFIKKRAAPGILIVALLVFSYSWWINRVEYTGLPLYEVTGQTLKDGKPAPGIKILLEPVGRGIDDPRHLGNAVSDADGNFRVMYDGLIFYGAPAGDYRIGLTDENGRPIEQSEVLSLTVKEDGDNELKINL